MAQGKELDPTPRFLLGPGPSDAHPRVLRAMATPLIGHLDPQFIGMMDDVKAMLQEIFRTKNDMTFTVSTPGSAGMETCLVNRPDGLQQLREPRQHAPCSSEKIKNG